MWLAVDPQGNFWIYDELWLGDMDLAGIALAIHAQEGGVDPDVRLIDPHMDKDNAMAGGFNVRKELMRHGVFCQRAIIDITLGMSRIKHALKPEYNQLSKTMQPKLRIMEHCSQTIYEFQHYLWDEYKRNKEEYEQKNTVKKKDDHFMDCLRYIMNHDPQYRLITDEDEEELGYSGTYTKYPSKQPERGSYRALVEGPASGHGGQF
jgi:hypothetical protein